MFQLFARLTLGFVFLFLLASLCGAAPARKILVGYKKSESPSPDKTEVRWHLEPILTKLGWKVEYHDLDASLPPAAKMSTYQAVLTWHRGAQYSNPKAYVEWMRDQVLAGRKIVILGNFGAHSADLKTWMSNEALNEFFQPFGLQYQAGYSGDSKLLELVSQKAPATAPKPLNYYLHFTSSSAANQNLVVVRRKDLADSQSALVVRTPAGGMVCEGYLYQTEGGKIRWLVDREAFLKLALESQPADLARTGGRLLALYKGSEEVNQETNYIARFASDPLKQLGYQVVYRDIESGLPTEAEMKGYNAVMSWYQTASMERAADYCKWLLQQIQQGRKVVILGNLGAFQELDPHSNPPTARWLLSHEYNSFLYPFGIEFLGMWTKESSQLEARRQDPKMVTWLEPSHLAHYYWLRSVNPQNKVFLEVARKDRPHALSAFLVSTPYGGYALESYLFRDTSGRGDYRWHFQLKDFLASALSGQAPPLPPAVDLAVDLGEATAPAPDLPQPPALPADVKPLKRRVLAFYQREKKEIAEKNAIKEVVETVLNHLGLVVDYRAIEDPLPSEAEMQAYRGILTWFQTSSIPRAQAYAEWLEKQLTAGRLAVLLGDYGAYQDRNFQSQVDPSRTFQALGLRFQAAPLVKDDMRGTPKELAGLSAGLSLEKVDPEMCRSERPIDLNDRDLKRGGWPVVESLLPENKVYLRAKDARGPSDLIVITPRGGIAFGEFLLYTPPGKPIRRESVMPGGQSGELASGPAAEEHDLPQWRIDPFRFFGQAFQLEDFPCADVTTLNGSRIYFSHIDGDAAGGISQIDGSSLNAEVMFREILQPSKLPTTVSFVTQDLYKKATATYQREAEAARAIFRLPWVELASHTNIHPFNWRDGDLVRVEDGGKLQLKKMPPDLRKEIDFSVRFIDQKLAPADKRTRVLLWSGLCNPPEEALERTDAVQVLNMNGGDPIYDSVNPYLAGISPLYARVGQRYQYHTCAAGDFYYTSSWTRDFDGMKRLVEYFKYTEEPRRLRAMNLYYHFYLAEKALGLEGLRHAMDYVRSLQPAPMFVSDYIPMVSDLITLQLGQDSQGRTVIHNSGQCRTLRWDNPSKYVDMARSQGVLGFLKEGNRLYVHLDSGQQHRVAWSEAPPAPGTFYLEKASHRLEGLVRKGTQVDFRLHGVGPAHFSFAGFKPGRYRLTVQGQGERPVTVGNDGKLQWQGELDRYQGQYAVSIR